MKTKQMILEEIAFTMIPRVGPVMGRQLITYCGSIEAVFTESKRILKTIPGIGEEIASQISNASSLMDAAAYELSHMTTENIHYVFYYDTDYPTRLFHVPDAPLLLYTKGRMNLQPQRSVAIIGTRKPTAYGKAITEELIETLKPYDVTVVSGLAYGIDITAHRLCLQHEIPTIGVMGSGMGTIYPDHHVETAHQMMTNGGIITEFAYDTGPDAVNFPMRNRIVAGLSDVLVVIESAIKGGSMITANLANDYNKDVMAVPGRKTDKNSAGCNHLIKRQQAHLIESGEDLIELMSWHRNTRQQTFQTDLFAEMSPDEQKIYRLIIDNEEKDIDTLAFHSKSTPGELAAILLTLEFKGAIKSIPGKKFVAIG